ncbi:2'-5' RNA ligase family protein [Streptomyces sp. NPDC058155]|uniref:2'-5' RNA ligase family protein n=1 Tax=Streptomyces sp. NPDC058155 TaxID=3346359 RepID=UPI0036E0CAD6
MENFFERVGRFWPAGRRDLHWHILPTPDEAAALIAPYQGLFPLGLENVPVSGVHCTLLHAVGLSAADIDTEALARDVAGYAQTVSPFTLTFDRPAVGNAGMEIGGWPGRHAFTGIVDAVTQATTRTGAGFSASPSHYPHLSLAYASQGAEGVAAVAIRTALSAISQPLSGTVFVDRLHLVEQWHDGAHIMWNPIAQVPFAGGTA